MRSEYIRQVKKQLNVPYRMKKEIVRDLNEMFDSAVEHGEAEESVIKRLGSPKEFAEGFVSEENGAGGRGRRQLIICIISAASAVICFIGAYLMNTPMLPKDAIGGGDMETDIYVVAKPLLDVADILVLFGTGFVVLFVVMVIRRKKSR